MEISYWEKIIEEQCILTQYLVSHTFSTFVYTVYITWKKNEETNHFQYKYTFYDQDHVC